MPRACSASDDDAAVEHAFGGVEQRVRGEDLLEGRGHLEVRSDDRGAEDRRVEPGELLEHAGDRPLRLLADGACVESRTKRAAPVPRSSAAW